MGRSSHQREWDELADLDGLWAILSEPGKRHNRWQADEFFATGASEVEDLIGWAGEHGLPTGRERALDVGCGVGRLTRALAAHFGTCLGIDISPRMIDEARAHNVGLGNVSFAVAGAQHLSCGEFDLVMSRLVLQHLSSQKEIVRAIDALAAAVRPGGGALVFDVTTHIPMRYRMQPKARSYGPLRRLGIDARVLYRRLGLVPIRMRAIDDRAVRTILARRRIKVVGERRSTHASGVRSTVYLAAKR
jgi:SAM-dependent methyltransferase